MRSMGPSYMGRADGTRVDAWSLNTGLKSGATICFESTALRGLCEGLVKAVPLMMIYSKTRHCTFSVYFPAFIFS
jgi:hypothetical protein